MRSRPPTPYRSGRLRTAGHCASVRNLADLDTLKHEQFSTQECVQNH
nr:MAG TPA: hypothetical protein [Caudoviricetes sp.]